MPFTYKFYQRARLIEYEPNPHTCSYQRNMLEPPLKLSYVEQVTDEKLSYWQDSGSSGFGNTELKPNTYEPV